MVDHPEIAAEWHPTKNGDLTPEEVTRGSTLLVWWLCSKRRHSWRVSVNSRTNRAFRDESTGCPYCSPHKSKTEIRIFCELKNIFEEVQSGRKLFNQVCDIYIKEHNCVIEYDGEFFHRKTKVRDITKSNKLMENGFLVIRIRSEKQGRLFPHDILYKNKESTLSIVKKTLNKLITIMPLEKTQKREIKKYLNQKNYINSSEYNKIISNFPGPEYEQSLKYLHPTISKSWNYQKNSPLLPEYFSLGSDAVVWWNCEKNHEWDSKIYDRVKAKGCPYCIGKRTGKDNNLKILFPEIALEWHPTKNGVLTPEDVTRGSGKKVWWKCQSYPEHEWKASIGNRARSKQPSGCPFCSGNKVYKDNNLNALFPEITAEWHPTKNDDLTPDQFALEVATKLYGNA